MRSQKKHKSVQSEIAARRGGNRKTWNRLFDYQTDAVILDKIFTNINSLYNPPKVFAPSRVSDHNIVV